MRHKYIRFKELGIILFPYTDDLTHAEVARCVERYANDDAISAGFVIFQQGKPCCIGRSESLHLDSQPEDTEILQKQFGQQ